MGAEAKAAERASGGKSDLRQHQRTNRHMHSAADEHSEQHRALLRVGTRREKAAECCHGSKRLY